MAGSDEGQVSIVDSTFLLKWELTKEQFDSCKFNESIISPKYTIKIGSEQSDWRIIMFPKGKGEESNRNKAEIGICQISKEVAYTMRFGFGVETCSGYWPNDNVKSLYSKNDTEIMMGEYLDGNNSYEYSFCSTEELCKKFVEKKMSLVATLVIFIEGKKYLDYLKMASDFVKSVRSMSDHDELCDFTIICGDKKIKCPKVLLAARSKVFKAKFEHDTLDKNEQVLNVEDSKPEVVEALIDFMSKGFIPDDIGNKAVELIHLADFYGLDLLVQACTTSLVNNLSADNAAETLIIIDRYVPLSEHREKIIDFIINEASEIVKSKDWKELYENYPDLVTDLFLSSCKRKVPPQN